MNTLYGILMIKVRKLTNAEKSIKKEKQLKETNLIPKNETFKIYVYKLYNEIDEVLEENILKYSNHVFTSIQNLANSNSQENSGYSFPQFDYDKV